MLFAHRMAVSSLWTVLCLVAQSCQTLCDPMDCSPPGSSVHGDSPDKNTGVGCHALPHGILPTQGLNPGLPHCRQILYRLSPQGSPRILEWEAIPSPADLPNPGIKLGSPAYQADSLPAELPGKPQNNPTCHHIISLFAHGKFLCSKVYFDINIATSF